MQLRTMRTKRFQRVLRIVSLSIKYRVYIDLPVTWVGGGVVAPPYFGGGAKAATHSIIDGVRETMLLRGKLT